MAAVRAAAPAPRDPFVDLIPGEGVRLTPRHYAYLKIAEGCDNRCTFCIIPSLAREPRLAPGGRRAARSRAAGESRRQGAHRHRPGHERLRARPQICDERMARPADAGALSRHRARTRHARRLGQAAICLPLSACRRGDRADERRQCAALYRRAVPARFAQGPEGDAAAGGPGKDARAHPRLARDLPGA